MAIINVNKGTLLKFSTKDGNTNKIIQIGGSEQIFPYTFHSDVYVTGSINISLQTPLNGVSQLTTNKNSISNIEGPIFVNALTYNIDKITVSAAAPITHSIGDLEIWSGNFNYTAGTAGGGALQCDTDENPILIDFTSSINNTQLSNGIPAGTVLIIYNASNTINKGLTVTGSFNMGTTQSLSTTDLAASLMFIRNGGGGNRWTVLSQTGNWTAT